MFVLRILGLILFLTIAGCGGGDDSTTTPASTPTPTPTATPTPDTSVPSVSILFPSENSVIVAGETIDIRGIYGGSAGEDITIRVDAGDGEIDAVVNTQDGTWIANNVSTKSFSAKISVTATVTNNNNNLADADDIETESLMLSSLYDVVVDSENRRLFFVDGALDALLSFDLETQESSLLLSPEFGGTAKLTQPIHLAYDSENKKIYIASFVYVGYHFGTEIIQYDLVTGSSVSITPKNDGELAPIEDYVEGMTLDSENGLIYFATRQDVFTLDINTGAIETVSGLGGIDFEGPLLDVLLDAESQVLYLAISGSDNTDRIAAYNLQDLTFNVVSGSKKNDATSDQTINVGNGPSLVYPIGIQLDKNKNRLIVLDGIPSNSITYIDLTSGDRTNETPSFAETGELLNSPTSFAYDLTNDALYIADYSIGLLQSDGKSLAVLDDSRVSEGPFVYGRPFVRDENIVYVASSIQDSIFSIDLTTGVRSEVWSSLAEDELLGGRTVRAMVLDKENNRLILSFLFDNRIYSLNISNGQQTLFSDLTPVSNEQRFDIRAMALDKTNNALYISDRSIDTLYSIDLDSGLAAEVAINPSSEIGTYFDNTSDIVVQDDFAYVISGISGSLIKVNLSTGFRTLLYAGINSPIFSNAPVFIVPNSIAFDIPNERLLVSNRVTNTITSVDPVSGEETLLFNAQTLQGMARRVNGHIELDGANNRLLTLSSGALISVNLSTGDGIVISH